LSSVNAWQWQSKGILDGGCPLLMYAAGVSAEPVAPGRTEHLLQQGEQVRRMLDQGLGPRAAQFVFGPKAP
jgi:hypothetical protein